MKDNHELARQWVPLTKLVGRTVWGETEAVVLQPMWVVNVQRWEWRGGFGWWRPFPDGTLDLDTGRVKVEPEGEQ